jgi:hypothetical protein
MKTWTAADIETLTMGFLDKTPLKVLAWQMKRTPSALNKAMTRFGIRKPREKKPKSVWNNFNLYEEATLVNPMCAIKRFDRKFRLHQKVHIKRWVDMDAILSLMDEKGHRVYVADAHKDPRCTIYTVDGRKMAALQLVLKANQYRLSQGKAPFCLK